MPKSKKKRLSDPYDALQRLMREPGDRLEIWDDLWGSIADPKERLVRALAGVPSYDDRAAAIMFGSMLEHALELAIASLLTSDPDATMRLFSYRDDGPLATFNAKINMGLALGVYEQDMRKDIWRIKEIRNLFAHARVRVDFGHDVVRACCDQLAVCANLNKEKWMADHTGLGRQVPMTAPRQKYTGATAAISHYLGNFVRLPVSHDSMRQFYRLMYGKMPPSPRKS